MCFLCALTVCVILVVYGCTNLWFKQEKRFSPCFFSNYFLWQSKNYKEHWNSSLGFLQLNLKSSSGSRCLRKGAPVPGALPTPEEMERSLQELIQTRESFDPHWSLAEVQEKVSGGCISGSSTDTGLRRASGSATAEVDFHPWSWVLGGIPPCKTGVPKGLKLVALVNKFYRSEENFDSTCEIIFLSSVEYSYTFTYICNQTTFVYFKVNWILLPGNRKW